MQLAFNLSLAKLRRDDGMAAAEASSGDWSSAARAAFRAILHTLPDELNPETWKVALIPLVGAPRSANAWGAFTVWAIKENLIEDTGRRTRSQLPASHATEARIYRRV